MSDSNANRIEQVPRQKLEGKDRRIAVTGDVCGSCIQGLANIFLEPPRCDHARTQLEGKS